MTRNDAKRGGFTFVEVLAASAISVFLFISAFEAMALCKKSALATACLSAAESYAYDEINWIFNKPLSWFDTNNLAEVVIRTKPSADVIKGYFPPPMKKDVVCITTIRPDNTATWKCWLISVDVEWKVPGVPGFISVHGDDRWHRLPEPPTVKRSAFLRWDGRFENRN